MERSIDISLLIENEIAREGLRRILLAEQFNVLSTATGAEAAQVAGRAHIVILDRVPESDMVDNCNDAHRTYPSARLVLIANDYDRDEVELAFGCGADGYLVKTIACEPLAASLRLVAMGQKVLPSQLAGNLCVPPSRDSNENWRGDAQSAGLSDRELEIVSCLTAGLSNKAIARRLETAVPTVKVHVKAILRKLRLDNRTQAAVWAIKHGFAEQAVAPELEDLEPA